MLGRRTTSWVAIVVAAALGLVLVPVPGVRGAPHGRPTGEEFGAPYDLAFTGRECSTRLTCDHKHQADKVGGTVVSEVRAEPNPGTPIGSGFGSTWSQLQAYVGSPVSVQALRVTVDVRMLKGSSATAERPSTPAEVGASVAVWHNGCEDCQGFTYASVLTASGIDNRPSTLAEDLPLQIVAEIRSKDGAPLKPGTFRVASMAFAYVGSTNLPTIGKVEAKAAMVVDRIKTEVLDA